MRYKQYIITPIWTHQTKVDILSDLMERDEEIESLKEQLETEKQYAQNILKCSEKLQKERDLYRCLNTFASTKPEEYRYPFAPEIKSKSWLEKSFNDIINIWKN